MSTNVFARLRSLLPGEAVLIARVVEHHEEDDTSTLELPSGLPQVPVGIGVSTGSLIRARGRTVAVGQNAFVRGGVVQSRAPDGDPVEIIVGSVVTAPRGPQGITWDGTVPAQAAAAGVAFALELAPYVAGFYAPVTWALTAGSLAGSGLELDAATGVVAGTPSGAGTLVGLVVTASDATGLQAASNVFSVVVT